MKLRRVRTPVLGFVVTVVGFVVGGAAFNVATSDSGHRSTARHGSSLAAASSYYAPGIDAAIGTRSSISKLQYVLVPTYDYDDTANVVAVAHAAPTAGTAPTANARIAAGAARPAAPASQVVLYDLPRLERAAKPAAERFPRLRRILADERGSIGGSEARDIGFGHGARHLGGTGLSRTEVEMAIEQQVRKSTAGAQVGGSFGGRLTVGGKTIEYRGYGLPNGRINIGTYYPVP